MQVQQVQQHSHNRGQHQQPPTRLPRPVLYALAGGALLLLLAFVSPSRAYLLWGAISTFIGWMSVRDSLRFASGIQGALRIPLLNWEISHAQLFNWAIPGVL